MFTVPEYAVPAAVGEKISVLLPNTVLGMPQNHPSWEDVL